MSLVTGAAVWFAPAMIARLGLCESVVGLMAPELGASLRVGSASLGWLSPVELREVTIQEPNAEPLARIRRLRTGRTLIQLLVRPPWMGTIYLEQPDMSLAVRSDGSNVEDFLQPWLAPLRDQQQSTRIGIRLEIVDGSIQVSQTGGDHRSRIETWTASLEVPLEGTRPIELVGSGTVRDDATPGEFSVRCRWRPPTAPRDVLGRGDVHLTCSGVPLQPLETLFVRWGESTRMSGVLDSDLHGSWGTHEHSGDRLEGRLAVQQFRCQAPRWFGADELCWGSVASQLRLSAADCIVHVHDLTLDGDFGHVEASGVVDVVELTQRHWPGLLRNLHGGDTCRIAGRLDLARLASTLPSTLQLRDGTEVRSGHLQFDITGTSQDDGVVWRGGVEAVGLSGVHRGTSVRWDQPLDTSVVLHDKPGGMVVERLQCQSDFLRVSAESQPGSGRLTAEGNLTQLAAKLNEFFEMRGVQLEGHVRADAGWQYANGTVTEAKARLTLDDFQLTLPTRPHWREPQLTITASVSGTVNPTRALRIEKGTVELTSGSDYFQANLTQPVVWETAMPSWPVSYQLRGALTSWSARLQPLVSFEDVEAAGAIQAKGTAVASLERLKTGGSNVELRNLTFRGHGLSIHEPLVRVDASGVWDRTDGRVSLDSMTLASSALAVRATGLDVQPHRKFASGDLGFRADLARLAGWHDRIKARQPNRLAGAAVGQVRLLQKPGVLSGEGRIDVEDFILPWWREERMSLQGAGRYDRAADRLHIEKASIVGDALRVTVSGDVAHPARQRSAILQGSLEYDLAKVSQKLNPYLGGQIRLTGKQTYPFSMRGPMYLAAQNEGPSTGPSGKGSTTHLVAASGSPAAGTNRLQLQTRFGWETAAVYGLALGPNDFDVRLNDGIVRTSPWDVPLSEGRLKLAPRLDVTSTPVELAVGQGPLVENVRITPEMCRSWLKYVAPLLADATQAEGRFSATLSAARLPLTAMHLGKAAGTLQVHQAQVLPGPLAKEFLTIAQQIRAIIERNPTGSGLLNPTTAWMEMPSQNIPFHMADGRVHHRRMQVNVGEVVIVTQGWVGVDQSLSLLAEIPIREQWVQRDRLLASLRGQSVRIPIRGTLNRPQIDRSEINKLSRQFLSGAAEQMLQDELQRQLQKLFGN